MKIKIRTSTMLITLLLCIPLLFSACSENDITGSEVTNENVIFLTGVVLDNNGQGVSDIEVELATLGFRDTTDLLGTYEISLSKDSALALGISVEGRTDTLYIKQQGELVKSYGITTFIDTLPDTYLIQRNVWGKLLNVANLYYSVEAVIAQKNTVPPLFNRFDIWLNNLTKEYSGFMYMLQQAGNPEFSIYINVYNDQKQFIGRGPTMDFPQNAGDLHFPDFAPDKTLPSVSISAATEAKINTPVSFKAELHENFFGGDAKVYLWNFGDGETANGKEVTHTFMAEKSHTVSLTIYDEDDRTATASHIVSITNGDATINGLVDVTTSINDEVVFNVSVNDENGVEKVLWDFGDGTGKDSTFDNIISSVTYSYPRITAVDTTFPVTVFAIDKLGDTTTLSKNITLLINAPLVKQQKDTVVSQTATVSITGNATDKNGTVTSYHWDINADGAWDAVGATQIFNKPEGGGQTIIWGAEDDDGTITTDTFSIVFNRAPTEVKLPATFRNGDMSWSATDPDGAFDTLNYTLKIGDTPSTLATVYSGKKAATTQTFDLGKYYYEIIVKDRFGDSLTHSGSFLTPMLGMKPIPAKDSSFFMGNNNSDSLALPIHSVSFTHNFWMDSIEVTLAQFDSVMSAVYDRYQIGSMQNSKRAADEINWYEAALYCNARSILHGKDTVYKFSGISDGEIGYKHVTLECVLFDFEIDYNANGFRLPSEAEWEYACYGGGYSYGNDTSVNKKQHFNAIASYFSSEFGCAYRTIDGATKLPNNFGLYDMIGNVEEWCNDWFGVYSVTNQVNPTGPDTGTLKILRGGYWGTSIRTINTSLRRYWGPHHGGSVNGNAWQHNTGFRTILVEQ